MEISQLIRLMVDGTIESLYMTLVWDSDWSDSLYYR